jgi:hypothetical protein
MTDTTALFRPAATPWGRPRRVVRLNSWKSLLLGIAGLLLATAGGGEARAAVRMVEVIHFDHLCRIFYERDGYADHLAESYTQTAQRETVAFHWQETINFHKGAGSPLSEYEAYVTAYERREEIFQACDRSRAAAKPNKQGYPVGPAVKLSGAPAPAAGPVYKNISWCINASEGDSDSSLRLTNFCTEKTHAFYCYRDLPETGGYSCRDASGGLWGTPVGGGASDKIEPGKSVLIYKPPNATQVLFFACSWPGYIKDARVQNFVLQGRCG